MIERWLGDRSTLPFIVILSLRSQLLRQPVATTLTVLTLAASVALAVSVELATRSVSLALEETTSAVMGRAEFEVGSGEAGVPEALIAPLRAVEGVASASPVIQHTFRIAGGAFDGEAIRVLGIDLLYESEVRDYHVSAGGFTVRDPLRLVASPNTVVVARSLAERLGIGEGDALRLRSMRGETDVVVRGFLEGDLAAAYGGQIAVADVYGLQELLALDRRVDWIDVALAAGADAEGVRTRLVAAVDGHASVRRSTLRRNYGDAILETLNVTTWVSTVIGVLLALFVTYAVASLTVDRRVEEFALLRAAGMHGRSVTRSIVTEILLLAIPGTLLGFGIAVAISDPLMAVFSRASAYLQHIHIPDVQVTARTCVVALTVGLPVALLASLEPAVRAGGRPPLEVLRSHRISAASARPRPTLLLAAAFAGLIATLLAVSDAAVSGLPRLALAMTLAIFAAGVGSAQLLIVGFRALQRVLGRAVPRVGHLAGAMLVERPVETGATLAIWAAITGGLVAIVSSVYSLTTTIDDFWIGMHGEDAIMVFAQDPLATSDREDIPLATIETIRETPGVAAVAPMFGLRALVRGEDVNITAVATDILSQRAGGMRSISNDPAASIAALRRGELLMNEGFARHFGVSVGDRVEVATNDGTRTLRIGGMGRGFWGGRTGVLHLEERIFRELFAPAGAPQITVWIDEARAPVYARLRERVDQPLFFRDGELMQRHTAHVMAKFNDLLLIPAGVIGSLGALALLNLLLGNVIGRRRDLMILRLAGGTRANVAGMVLTNGILVGLVGTASGLLMGIAWMRVTAEVLAGTLGYRLSLQLDLPAFGLIGVGAFLLAVLASLGPAILGSRTKPLRGPALLE